MQTARGRQMIASLQRRSRDRHQEVYGERFHIRARAAHRAQIQNIVLPFSPIPTSRAPLHVDKPRPLHFLNGIDAVGIGMRIAECLCKNFRWCSGYG